VSFRVIEPGQHQARFQRIRGLVQEHAIPDVDGIAGEVTGVDGIDDDAFVGRNSGLDGHARIEIECGRVIHQEAVRQRAETGIDVVEALVRQANRDDLEVEELADLLVRLDLGAKTVARPEPWPAAVVQAISGTFETDLLIQRQQLETVLAKPGLEVRFFRAPLVRHKVTRDGLVTIDGPGICREHHVRQLGLGLYCLDLRALGDGVAKVLPLPLGQVQAH
jgi:hypothetical protein